MSIADEMREEIEKFSTPRKPVQQRTLSENALDLLSRIGVETISEDEITSRDYATKYDVCIETARKRLIKLEKDGVLTSRSVRFGGCRVKAYRESNSDEEKEQ